MAIQTINLGNLVNDGLGDDLRTAFTKVNANFASLQAEVLVTASNVNETGVGVFKQKTGSNLEFKKLVPGNKITLVPTENAIVVNTTQPDAFTSITANSGGILEANTLTNTTDITIRGGADVTTSISGSVLTIDTVQDLNQILQVVDFGGVDGTYNSVVQMNLALSNFDFGTLSNPGTFSLDVGTI